MSGEGEFWGVRPFDDELSADWFEDLLESDPAAFFAHCLDLSDVDIPHRLACIGVVCTAAVLAAVGGRCDAADLPEAVRRWVDEHRHQFVHLSPMSHDAIESLRRVRQGPSHLRDRWRDAGEEVYRRWEQVLTTLEKDLTPTGPV